MDVNMARGVIAALELCTTADGVVDLTDQHFAAQEVQQALDTLADTDQAHPYVWVPTDRQRESIRGKSRVVTWACIAHCRRHRRVEVTADEFEEILAESDRLLEVAEELVATLFSRTADLRTVTRLVQMMLGALPELPGEILDSFAQAHGFVPGAIRRCARQVSVAFSKIFVLAIMDELTESTAAAACKNPYCLTHGPDGLNARIQRGDSPAEIIRYLEEQLMAMTLASFTGECADS